MDIFPHYSEILVSGMGPQEVIGRLKKVTRDVNFLDYDVNSRNFKFNGVVLENTFKISLVIDKADSFLPLITGKIEKTPLGCILFLKYKLFPGAGFFLGFWSFLTLLLAIFFVFIKEEPVFGMISLLLGVGNYLFAKSHFYRKIKKSQLIFHQLLNPDEID